MNHKPEKNGEEKRINGLVGENDKYLTSLLFFSSPFYVRS
jgi:hypothetical protein